jgi:hypothetical protein
VLDSGEDAGGARDRGLLVVSIGQVVVAHGIGTPCRRSSATAVNFVLDTRGMQRNAASGRGLHGVLRAGRAACRSSSCCCGNRDEVDCIVGFDLYQERVLMRCDSGRVDLPIIGGDLDRLGVVDDVIVRYGISIRRDEEARALGKCELLQAATVWQVRDPEILEEPLKRRAFWQSLLVFIGAQRRTLGLDPDADRHDRRLHSPDDSGEACRPGRFGRRRLGDGGCLANLQIAKGAQQ